MHPAGARNALSLHVHHNAVQSLDLIGPILSELADLYLRMPQIVHEHLPTGVALVVDDGAVYAPQFCARDVGHTGCSGEARYEIRFPAAFFFDAEGLPTPEVEEMFLHELAHLMDWSAGWLDQGCWERAVQRDGGRYVTEYASTDIREDFAETFVAWTIYRGMPSRVSPTWRAHVRDTARNRLVQYFDLLHRNLTLRPGRTPW